MIGRRYLELQSTLKDLEAQFADKPREHLENAITNVLQRYDADMKVLNEHQEQALKRQDEDDAMREAFGSKDLTKIETMVDQASEALAKFKSENTSNMHPGSLGSE